MTCPPLSGSFVDVRIDSEDRSSVTPSPLDRTSKKVEILFGDLKGEITIVHIDPITKKWAPMPVGSIAMINGEAVEVDTQPHLASNRCSLLRTE